MNQELLQKKREVIDFFLKKNILLSDDILQQDLELNFYDQLKKKIDSNDFLILNSDLKNMLDKVNKLELNWFELERGRVLLEKKKDNKIYSKFMEYFILEKKEKEDKKKKKVEVIFSYKDTKKKKKRNKTFYLLF